MISKGLFKKHYYTIHHSKDGESSKEGLNETKHYHQDTIKKVFHFAKRGKEEQLKKELNQMEKGVTL